MVSGMTPLHDSRPLDLWLFGLLWTLLLVLVALWLNGPSLPAKAEKKPLEPIRYVGEKGPRQQASATPSAEIPWSLRQKKS